MIVNISVQVGAQRQCSYSADGSAPRARCKTPSHKTPATTTV